MTSRLALLLPLFLAACSSPTMGPQAAPNPGPAEPAQSTTGLPAAATDAPPSASVTDVQMSKESELYVKAKVIFKNPGRRPCTINGYKVTWGPHRKAVELRGLSVPPGETRERWLKVGPADGNIDALTPAAAKVEVQAECGGS